MAAATRRGGAAGRRACKLTHSRGGGCVVCCSSWRKMGQQMAAAQLQAGRVCGSCSCGRPRGWGTIRTLKECLMHPHSPSASDHTQASASSLDVPIGHAFSSSPPQLVRQQHSTDHVHHIPRVPPAHLHQIGLAPAIVAAQHQASLPPPCCCRRLTHGRQGAATGSAPLACLVRDVGRLYLAARNHCGGRERGYRGRWEGQE